MQPFPGPGGRRKISENGGLAVVWSSNGRELLFRPLDGYLMVVDYQVNGDAFIAGRPRRWNDTGVRVRFGTLFLGSWDLHPDGERVAMSPVPEADPNEADGPRFGYLLNFFDELRRLAPPE